MVKMMSALSHQAVQIIPSFIHFVIAAPVPFLFVALPFSGIFMSVAMSAACTVPAGLAVSVAVSAACTMSSGFSVSVAVPASMAMFVVLSITMTVFVMISVFNLVCLSAACKVSLSSAAFRASCRAVVRAHRTTIHSIGGTAVILLCIILVSHMIFLIFLLFFLKTGKRLICLGTLLLCPALSHLSRYLFNFFVWIAEIST